MIGAKCFIFTLSCFICLQVLLSAEDGNTDNLPEENCPDVNPGVYSYKKTLETDSSNTLNMKWIGKTLLLYTTNNESIPSLLFTSSDHGRSLQNKTDVLLQHTISEALTICTDRVLLILYNKNLQTQSLITLSSGGENQTFSVPRAILFKFHGNIHSHPQQCHYLATLGEVSEVEPVSSSQIVTVQVYISTNLGIKWTPVIKNATDVRWDSGLSNKTSEVFMYMLVNTSCAENGTHLGLDLVRTAINSSTFTTIAHHVRKFTVTGKYIFALVHTNKPGNKFILKVSTSQGRVWNPALFPERVDIKDFFVQDNPINELIFLHIRQLEGSGIGTLYISDKDGLIFTKSLMKHKLKDDTSWSFIPLLNMQGSILAEQYQVNDSHTVISFNNGKKWTDISCNNSSTNVSDCHLKLLRSFQGMQVDAPIFSCDTGSLPVILAHGLKNRNDSSKDIKVYASDNGGHSWFQSLTGKFQFASGMFGSILIAVYKGMEQITIKYSLNGGHHWDCLNYQLEDYMEQDNITVGLNSSLATLLVQSRKRAHLLFLNFSSLVNRSCTTNDFEEMIYPEKGAHSSCLLGLNRSFWKLKTSSRCLIESRNVTCRNSPSCPCTIEDYECDFGFIEKGKMCVPNPFFMEAALDVCQEGEEPTCQTTKYRKRAGDECSGGWNPKEHSHPVYRLTCFDLSLHISNKYTKLENAVIALIVMIVLITILGMAAFFFHKLQQLRRQVPTFHYSKLNQDDQNNIQVGDEDSNETLVDLSSEEEEFEALNQSPAKLHVQSRTVSSPSHPVANGVPSVKSLTEESIKSLLEDTDDELLQ